MSTPTESAISLPGRPSPPERSNSVPFPSDGEQSKLKESGSSTSNLTSSDKLSALPTQSSPVLERLRSPNRTARRSFEASSSLTSITSDSDSLRALHALPGPIRQSESDSSIPKDTPRQRNESERSLPATLRNSRQAVTGRQARHSDSLAPSPSLRSRDGSSRGQLYSQSPPPSRQGQGPTNRPPSNNLSPPMQGRDTFQTSPSRSPAQSRATSPLRIFHGWNLHRNHTRDEPFIPVDPFSSHIRWFGFRREHSPARPIPEDTDVKVFDVETKPKFSLPWTYLSSLCLIGTRKRKDDDDNYGYPERPKRSAWRMFMNEMSIVVSYTFPRQLFLWFLLHLPMLYWQRVARVFEDAELSKPELERLIDAQGYFAHDPSVDAVIATGFATPPVGGQKPLSQGLPYPEEWTPPMVSPALARFKISWENFVDTLMREWKTFNLVSALLCTTILTIFQIQDAADDPVTRWSALFSLVFALMSLSYGCVYIVYFGTMRSMDRASRWAQEASKTRTALLWNIWVLLATPAIWLAWSMISFCVAILSFVWRTGSSADRGYSPLTPTQALGVRIAISVLFAFGLFNFWMIIRTFSSYSHISVRRDRRSRFRRGTGTGAGANEERGRERKKHTPGHQHGATSDEEKEKEKSHGHGRPASESMAGLGLSGLGTENSNGGLRQGSPNMAGVILENVDLEKGEGMYLTGERVGLFGRVSPRFSPKVSPKL